MKKPRISYYAHHMGTGHLRHARRIIDTGAFEVQVASTGEKHRDLLPRGADYISLPPDTDEQRSERPVLGEFLHYAPRGKHIVDRFSALNRAWEQFAPDVVMVDVSIEVALFARLSGYRVALRRMPGKRTDKAHKMGYAIADALFAYFPEALEEAKHLAEYGPKSYYFKTPQPVATSAVDLNESIPKRHSSSDRRRVVVQTSLGALVGLSNIAHAARSSPLWSWDVLGVIREDTEFMPANLTLHGIVQDPSQIMAKADVVLTSTGHNAVAAAAACGKPVLLIPEERPFDEQRSYAQMLQQSAGCMMLDSWLTPLDWNAALDQAAAGDPRALPQLLFTDADEFTRNIEAMIRELMSK